MTQPNPATVWGRVLVDTLVSGGLDTVCISPGSRSTPLTLAFAAHPDVRVYSHLDERSGAYFALGRSRRTGTPTALVCTSGTAAANFHPAVIEADRGRVPLIVLTADRPRELRDSGANQTIDQVDLYGDAVRWTMDLPNPTDDQRSIRSLRTIASRSLIEATGAHPGPVHLNCPFRKPLEPTADELESMIDTGDWVGDWEYERDGDDTVEYPHVHDDHDDQDDQDDQDTDEPQRIIDDASSHGVIEGGDTRIRSHTGVQTLETVDYRPIVSALERANRPVFVVGPADQPGFDPDPLVELADVTNAPILADPLSSIRFGSHVSESLVCGGYDTYIDVLPSPDVIVRIGGSPTSKPLEQALENASARQFLIDPAGKWRDATFRVTDLIVADPLALLSAIRSSIDEDRAAQSTADGWAGLFERAEDRHWECYDTTKRDSPFEGQIVGAAIERAPDPSTVFVSNSMPIRDADRFGKPRSADVTLLGNRGASGIDGITSSALGAGSATDDPLVLVTGDIAFYHDSNGLLAIDRCDVDATIVICHNDGGGIFHMLPIESFDPPFTSHFKTPHGIDFAGIAESYGCSYESIEPDNFTDAYERSLQSAGTDVISVALDGAENHRRRAEIERAVKNAVSKDVASSEF